MAQETITYACITQNNVTALKRNFEKVLPYVDRAIIIDGGSQDETEAYCKSLAPKVEWYQREWNDSFCDQYNEYLKHISGGWVLINDDDELPSDDLLKNMRRIADESNEGSRYSVVEFRCNPIYGESDNGPSNHYRQIFFRYNKAMRYNCNLHQYVVGYQNNKIIKSGYVYYHIKTTKNEFRGACRNYWIGGLWVAGSRDDGLKPAEYWELRELVKKHHPEVKVFNHLAKLMEDGKIHVEIKQWIVRNYRKFESTPDYNELRAYYTWYFKHLHLQEKPEDYT